MRFQLTAICSNLRGVDEDLNIEDVLNAYACGWFPMAESRHSDIFHWYEPERRGQLSIERLHIPARLRRLVLASPYEIRIDNDFAGVIDGCAAAAPGRPDSWINPPIMELFKTLHAAGHAHSVEAWRDGALQGGLYGLALGGAFMGESMFSRARDASKVALVHLCARLWRGGFTILDTQFVNPHLLQFGVYEIDSTAYQQRLRAALNLPADFALRGQDEAELVAAYLAFNRADAAT